MGGVMGAAAGFDCGLLSACKTHFLKIKKLPKLFCILQTTRRLCDECYKRCIPSMLMLLPVPPPTFSLSRNKSKFEQEKNISKRLYKQRREKFFG